jgi:hypothetical protein
MIDFAHQKGLLLLGAPAIRDVDGDAADADQLAISGDGRRGGAEAPAELAVRPADTELGLA